MLTLQLQEQLYSEAVATFSLIEASGDAEGIAAFDEVIGALGEIRADDSEYSLPRRLDESGFSSFRLFKPAFTVSGREDVVSEVRLRCEKHYIAFRLQLEMSYGVPSEWGECSVQFLGQPNSDFSVLQHKEAEFVLE